MTDEERKMLQDIHRAFFEVPPGSGEDDKPLIEGIRIMWRSYQRGSWAMRVVIWGLPALAGVGVAVQQIRGWWE